MCRPRFGNVQLLPVAGRHGVDYGAITAPRALAMVNSWMPDMISKVGLGLYRELCHEWMPSDLLSWTGSEWRSP